MAGLPAALSRQVGPFPVGGWLAIGAAGVGLAVIIRRSDLFGGAGEVDAIDAGDADPAADGSLYAPVAGYGDGVVPITPQPRPATPTGPTTNGEWSRAAVSWAIGAGHDPNTAAAAAANYLGGLKLTAAQGVILGKMLAQLGPPPEGAPAPDVTPTTPVPVLPATPPTPAPRVAPGPTTLYYTTISGSTFAGIAQHFYGSISHARVLHASNRYIKQPGIVADIAHRYPAGVRVYLPNPLPDGVKRVRSA